MKFDVTAGGNDGEVDEIRGAATGGFKNPPREDAAIAFVRNFSIEAYVLKGKVKWILAQFGTPQTP